ncbi:MAG: cobalamin B12-binding domain-containing protein [Verrucomicrobia bacterium]|nr:cobalamin B12-binding domain-containing protein [Verrucomicrobiota bacterium]
MRITFVYPDHESLGVQYLMALAASKGHETPLVLYITDENFHVNRLEKPSDVISRLRNPQDDARVDIAAVARRALETRPDLIAFSCVTDNSVWQIAVAGECKRLSPGTPTIFGGIHVTSVPREMLKRPEVDAVAIGEADISFVEFLEKCRRGERLVFPDDAVKGIIFKKGGALVGKEEEGPLANLDSLPYPSKLPWMSSPGLEYMRIDYKMMASRGCPYACSYCLNSLIHKLRGRRLVRRRSVKNVIGELLEARKANPHLQVVQFWDDCFASNLSWLREFKEPYINQVGLPFKCITIPETLTEEAVGLLKDMGCYGIQMGVQSLSEKLQREVFHRRFDAARIARTITLLNENGIHVYADHLLGVPHDTVESQEKAMLFYSENRPEIIHAFWLNYYPRTDIAKIALDSGDLSQTEYEEICSGKCLGATRMFSLGSDESGRLARFIPCYFMLKYVPVLPDWLVRFWVRTRFYRMFQITNPTLAVLLPNYIKECGGFGEFFRLCWRQFLQWMTGENGAGESSPIPPDEVRKISIELLECPASVARGSHFGVKARIVNGSRIPLDSCRPFPIRLGYHWADAATGQMVVRDGERTSLIPALRGRSARDCRVFVSAPPTAGTMKLQVRLVQEGVCWYEERDPSHQQDRDVVIT